ncbi:MAG: hypothetical protein KUG79_02930 [Pseudomonadales bacterium]|nr:hypothetical protein [Pseudomonadales bacterium]
MKIYLCPIIVVIASLFSFSVLAINKCTDANGNISYQDNLCAIGHNVEVMQSKRNRDSASTKNLDPVYVTIPGVGRGVLFSYKWWGFRIIQPATDIPPTVKMVSRSGEEPINFSLTFIPNRSGKKISIDDSAATVVKIASRYVAGSVEKEVRLAQLDTTIGPAVYTSFNEEKYLSTSIPRGQYSSITVGQAVHSKFVVGFTILTNGTDSKALSEAFNIISSIQIVAD